MDKSRDWAVLFQGEVFLTNDNGDEASIWKEGIEQADLKHDEAFALSEQLNAKGTDFEFWVVHITSNNYQKLL